MNSRYTKPNILLGVYGGKLLPRERGGTRERRIKGPVHTITYTCKIYDTPDTNCYHMDILSTRSLYFTCGAHGLDILKDCSMALSSPLKGPGDETKECEDPPPPHLNFRYILAYWVWYYAQISNIICLYILVATTVMEFKNCCCTYKP